MSIHEPEENYKKAESSSVNELAIKVAKLEVQIEHERNSIVKRLGAWGGLIALVLSVSTGAFSLYDNFVLKPRQERAATGGELRKIVGRLSEINSRLTEVQLERDLTKLRALSMAANAEKATILARADWIIDNVRSEASFPDFIALSFEHSNFGNSERSLLYANAALEVAETEQFRGEALRYKARALFAPGPVQDIQAARGYFEDSIATFKKSGVVGHPGLVLNTYVDWVLFEAVLKGCDAGRNVYKRLEQELIEMPAPAEVISASKSSIRIGLEANSICDGIVPTSNKRQG